MTASIRNNIRRWLTLFSCIVAAALAMPALSPAASGKQLRFSTPEKAVAALVEAVRAHDEKAMLAVLGPAGKELISSGDEAADRTGREKFIRNFDLHNELVRRSATTMVLQTGADSWSLPIPIVKRGSRWLFDTKKGKQEILNRRIGRNELHVIETLHAYVDAQHEYATKDCSSCGRVVFAQKLISTPGKRDGLYWETKEGEKESPLGPLVGKAEREGYMNADLEPFHGYYFRVMKGQGKHAEGGAYTYVVDGKMILGFALVAYPAEYGNSGIMTFIVNQKGEIYQKNLGGKTTRIAEAMTVFDPDGSWKKVKEPEKGK